MFDKKLRMHDIPRHYYEFCTTSYDLSKSYAPPMPRPLLRQGVAMTCYENFKPFKILVAFPRHATSREDFCTTTTDIGQVLYEFTKKVGGA